MGMINNMYISFHVTIIIIIIIINATLEPSFIHG